VFIASGASTCGECGEVLGRHAWITLAQEKVSLCLTCADLDHLVYLPARDVPLTQRICQHSTLVAVVLKWSRARKRYERQGLLIEAQALEQAEQEYLADSEARARRREREVAQRAELSRQYVERFTMRVRKLFPCCPPGREEIIAEYACLKYGSRIGRSAAVQRLDEEAIQLAVIAHIRHAETSYDTLLAQSYDYQEARAQVAEAVERILTAWTVSG
jgi:hypothetical protein